MWTMVALFCNLVGPEKGVCVPAVPPVIFQSYEDCQEFAVAETTGIDLIAVSYEYQCVQWQNKI